VIVPKTLAENQKSYEKRRLEEGWRRMTVWVPPHLQALATKYLDELRQKSKLPAEFFDKKQPEKVVTPRAHSRRRS
jgi:hypothetical protein